MLKFHKHSLLNFVFLLLFDVDIGRCKHFMLNCLCGMEDRSYINKEIRKLGGLHFDLSRPGVCYNFYILSI